MSILENIRKEKVKWRRLGDVCRIKDNLRKPVKESDRIKGNTPYYGANNIQDYVEGYTHEGEYVLVAEDGSRSLENYSIQWTTGKFWANNHVHVIQGKEELNNRFLYFYLSNMNFMPYLIGGNRAKLTKSSLVDIQIPIPSLETQTKIVEILDKFTEYIAALNEELTLRVKQYEYYRDLLLREEFLAKKTRELCGEDRFIEFKKLENIFNIRNGYTPSKSVKEYWENGNVPWFKMEDIRQNGNILYDSINKVTEKAVKGQKFIANSIILSTSATIGEHAIIKVPFLANQRFTIFSLKQDYIGIINMKFIYYYFYKIDDWCKKNTKLGNFLSVDISELSKQGLFIPPLKVQQYIVDILDKFDTLANDLKEGLPREIELRGKQYEYYREKLFEFKK